MKPLSIKVVAYAPTAYFHCQHCELVWQQAGVGQTVHAEQLANNLPDDVMHEYRRLSDWIIGLINRYGERLVVHVIDAASFEGFITSLRYGIRRYPAIILDGREAMSLSDPASTEAAIEHRLSAPARAA